MTKTYSSISFGRIAGKTLFVFLWMSTCIYSQTAPNTVITNQAKALYQFKSEPLDTVHSNVVQFSVLDAPNFEISFNNPDSVTFSKETVDVHIVYKNIGNKTADTAAIEGVLPPAGMRFVPGSTAGTISGNSIQWKIFNIPSGKTDSVKVRVVIDSNLVNNTQINLQASLNWQSSSITALKTFLIGSFPRLSISIAPSANVVGAGRTIDYRITVTNTGNISSVNTQLYDTISTSGVFLSSSVTPDSISSNKRLIKWGLGALSAFSSKEIVLRVITLPVGGSGQLQNAGITVSSNVPQFVNTTNTISIVPVIPKSVAISVEPDFIFGKMNSDSSKITVVFKDSTNENLPDGLPVQFAASVGTFSNNSNAVSSSIDQGKAVVMLRSIDVSNDIVRSRITVIGGDPVYRTLQDTVNVFMFPGAVTGVVVNGVNRVPFQGAIARVYNSQKKIVGADTTQANGKFFIALSKDVAKYSLEIIVIDKFGDTIRSTSDIDPTRFPLPPIVIPNIISGRIEYKVTGNPVPAENITVYLDSVSAAGNLRKIRTAANRNSGELVFLSRVHEQKTDKNGKFKFENLQPAKYVLSVDSIQFPNFTGYTFLTDTAAGTFTLNLNLQIVLDSSIALSTSSPASANAGDTVNVGVSILNIGTSEHYAVTITDTLSSYVKYISAARSTFSSVVYDSVQKIVQWQRDTLKTLAQDSVTLRYVVANNIPDSTRITNRIWYKSNSISSAAVSGTTIRSAGIVQFSNRFTIPKDTITAGDSIRHIFTFKNVGTDSLRGMRIVDTLFSAGLSGISLAKSAIDSTVFKDSVSTVYIGTIAPGQSDSVSLKLITDFGIRNGVKISSHAYMMKGNTILSRSDTSLVVNENPNLSSYLAIVKTGNKKVAEIGDIVTYQIQINNASPQMMKNIAVVDLLPYAFKYVKNSARFNGKPVEPVGNPLLNQLKWNVLDTLFASKNASLVYQLVIGADAMESEGMNTAYASTEAGTGTILVSAPSQWQVTVRPGVFTEKGLIIGKIFYDDNRNTFQDAGENGIKGIELWMEDGTKIVTGDDGKFSLPEVKPGQHVLRVNELTLPPETDLLLGDNKFAKDPSSRFVTVTEGGIAKSNFYLKRNTSDSVVQTLSKVNKLIAVRQAKPKYLYEDTLRKLKVDTTQIFVSFVYSGNKSVESIEITDLLPDQMKLVPNSCYYNGKTIVPLIEDNTIVWKIGKSKDVTSGVIQYRAVLTQMPKPKTLIHSSSVIRVTAIDSIVVESGKIVIENSIVDTSHNKIETSEIITSTNNPRISNHLSDSISISAGDVVYFKTSLFIDPKKKIKSVKLLDSLESVFIINDRSFTVNGIPLPSKNLSLKMRSSAISSAARVVRDEIDFYRVASVNLTELIKSGINEIAYSALLQSAVKDTVYKKNTYAVIVNNFNETKMLKTNSAKMYVKTGVMSNKLALESVYVDIPRHSMKVEEKVAEAVKLIESLKQNSSKAVVMEGIAFEVSKATLTKESKIVLDNIAAILLENAEINLQINGYTDNTGNAAANRKMSLNRAKEVAAYLTGKGINMKRLLPQGFGPTNPIASNKTEEGRSKNRRVEFARMK